MSSQSPVVWWYREVNCDVVRIEVQSVTKRNVGFPGKVYVKIQINTIYSNVTEYEKQGRESIKL
jgi:hypothetical protein